MVISSCLDGGFGRFGHAGAGDRTHTLHLGASYLGKKEKSCALESSSWGTSLQHQACRFADSHLLSACTNINTSICDCREEFIS